MKLLKYKKNNKKINFYLKNKVIFIKGSLGELSYALPKNCINLKNNKIFISTMQINFFKNKIKNLFWSVTKGWSYPLNIKGKGFKLFKYKNYLSFDLGYSNLFLFKNKSNLLNIHSTKYKIIVSSLDKSLLLNLISLLKMFYGLNKYHNKGFFFKNDKKMIYKKLI